MGHDITEGVSFVRLLVACKAGLTNLDDCRRCDAPVGKLPKGVAWQRLAMQSKLETTCAKEGRVWLSMYRMLATQRGIERLHLHMPLSILTVS